MCVMYVYTVYITVSYKFFAWGRTFRITNEPFPRPQKVCTTTCKATALILNLVGFDSFHLVVTDTHTHRERERERENIYSNGVQLFYTPATHLAPALLAPNYKSKMKVQVQVWNTVNKYHICSFFI